MSVIYSDTPASSDAPKKHYRMQCESGGYGANMAPEPQFEIAGVKVSRDEFIAALLKAPRTSRVIAMMEQLGVKPDA